ncbi:MAG: NAD(P)/FAD-dependent oxidoreductase [Clostridia bacterium]|nr:NAD(P)/FAD-dependent oxidoreductase [Clostridia bacterium]
MSEIIVVGGGAAGMMAAVCAARGGARVTLIERNEKLGKKIYITGKGRCNVTNAASEDGFMRAIQRNPRFCYAALSNLNSAQLMAFFEERGVPLKVERGERVFPASDHASDITRALEREMARLHVNVYLNTRVREIMLGEDGAAAGVATETGRMYRADAVIVATGGQSYPSTDSTGDGWAMAEATGHRTKPPLPALTSIETEETWPWPLSGLTLKNVALSAFNAKGKRFYCEQGELLLTHFGISGPLALTLSSMLPEEPAGVRMEINLKPALDEAALDRRLVRDLTELSRKQLATVMDGLEPHALGLAVLELARLSPALPANALTQEGRRSIARLLRAMPLTVKRLRGLEEAIVTRGGVVTADINPSTMESKRVPRLYFAGETIDIDALTGGFNLQLAFSTGALAGKCAAEEQIGGSADE